MVTKGQSEAISEALLSPARGAQEAAQRRKEAQHRNAILLRRSGNFGLAGLLLGGVAGYFLHVHIVMAALVGMGIGYLVGRVIYGRAA